MGFAYSRCGEHLLYLNISSYTRDTVSLLDFIHSLILKLLVVVYDTPVIFCINVL